MHKLRCVHTLWRVVVRSTLLQLLPRGALRAKFGCPLVRSTLLPNRLGGATLENRGVLHSIWPGPLWTYVSPIGSGFQNPNRDGIAIIFDDLSHGLCYFFHQTTVTFFRIMMTENTKMKPKKQWKGKNKKIYKIIVRSILLQFLSRVSLRANLGVFLRFFFSTFELKF